VDFYTTIRGTNTGDFVTQEYDALRTLSEIAIRTKCAIVLVYHHSKGQHEDKFDNAAGSSRDECSRRLPVEFYTSGQQ
jgi:RecA-family ATPase